MKTLLTLLFISISMACLAQVHYDTNSKLQPTSKEILRMNKNGFEYTLQGTIEIDGHWIKTDSCKVPFKLIVSLSGVYIKHGNARYNSRQCEKPDCELIHIQPLLSGTTSFGTPLPFKLN